METNTDVTITLKKLLKLLSSADASKDIDEMWDAVYAFRENESVFTNDAQLHARETYDYFSRRIALEVNVYASEPDDVATQARIDVAKSFIAVFPALEIAGELSADDFIKDAIFRQLCRDLYSKLRSEISYIVTSQAGREALKDDVESLIECFDFEKLISILSKKHAFTSTFIGIATEFLRYGANIFRKPSVMTYLFGDSSDSDDLNYIFWILNSHKEAMKIG